MLKVAYACHHHGYAIIIAVFYRFVVAYRTTGLYHSSYTGLVCNFHAVAEWEERIRGHYGTIQVEVEAVSLLYSLFQSIYSRSLSYSACTQLLVLCKHNGVALAVLNNLVGK